MTERKKATGKGKGSAFERKIAGQLSLWLTDGQHDDFVWRTSNSGGRHTVRVKNGKNSTIVAGDLTYTNEEVAWFFDMFSIELKKGYPAAEISALIDSKQAKPQLIQFWEQAINDAGPNSTKQALLIVARNNRIPLIYMSNITYRKLLGLFGEFPLPRAILTTEKYKLVVLHFQQFLNLIDPQTLKGGL